MSCGICKGIARWGSFTFGLLTLIGALIHIFNVLGQDKFCYSNIPEYPDGEEYSCLGANLNWGNTLGKSFSENNGLAAISFTGRFSLKETASNYKWRDVFTTAPDHFVDTWAPFFAGLAPMLWGFESLRWSWVKTWAGSLGYWLFCGLFTQIGYAGNWGIVIGILNFALLCPLLFILMLVDPDDEIPHPDLSGLFGTRAKGSSNPV